jgi:hypothetical protein
MSTQQNELIAVIYEAPTNCTILEKEAVFAKIPTAIRDSFLHKKRGIYKGLSTLVIDYDDKKSLAYLENNLVLQHG